MANAEKASHHQEGALPKKFFGMRNKTKKATSVKANQIGSDSGDLGMKGKTAF